jgi:hypothetical protein
MEMMRQNKICKVELAPPRSKNWIKIKTTTLLLLTLGFLNLSGAAFAEEPMRIGMDVNSVSVYQGQHDLLCYRYEDVPFKPYVQRLY